MSFRLKLLLLLAGAVAAGLALSFVLARPLLAPPEDGPGPLWRVLPGLLIVAAAAWIVVRRLTRSVGQLSDAASRLGAGRFADQIAVPSTDPLGPLARSLEQASARLESQLGVLESERNHLTTILDSMNEGVLAVDGRARITGINPALRKMFDVELEAAGRHPLEVIRNVEISRGIDRALGGERPRQVEVTVGERVLLARFAPFGPAERITGVVAVLHDITELRRLERARREFISNVSHELKTPLTSIQGYAETLLEAEGIDETQRRFVQRIFRNARELSEMIDELFNLARLEGEQVPLSFSSVRLSELLAEIESEFGPLLRKKGLELRVDDRSGIETVQGSRLFLQRVFKNLVENAVTYTDRGGIEVRVDRRAGGLLCSVRDTGVGIPEQDLSRVFERFYRVDRDRSRRTGGSGIGLAIVKHIVRLHGGEVWAESEAGKGTTILFTLPMPGDPEPPTAQTGRQ